MKKTIEKLTEKIEQLEIRSKSKDLFEIIMPTANSNENPIVYNHRTSSFIEKILLEEEKGPNKSNGNVESKISVTRQNSRNWKNFMFDLAENPNKL